jgi:hypothetical protein
VHHVIDHHDADAPDTHDGKDIDKKGSAYIAAEFSFHLYFISRQRHGKAMQIAKAVCPLLLVTMNIVVMIIMGEGRRESQF